MLCSLQMDTVNGNSSNVIISPGGLRPLSPASAASAISPVPIATHADFTCLRASVVHPRREGALYSAHVLRGAHETFHVPRACRVNYLIFRRGSQPLLSYARSLKLAVLLYMQILHVVHVVH